MKYLVALLCLVLVVGATSAESNQSEFKWLLEESLQEDYVPLFEADIAGPDERGQAMAAYAAKDYRTAALILEKIAAMQLPDGDLDFVRFALAESYRMLGLREYAQHQYRLILRYNPGSTKAPPALYRLLSAAAQEGRAAEADSLFTVFHMINKVHPLYASVLYEMGKMYFREGRFGEGYQLLTQIPPESSRHVQARFLAALCHSELKEWDKALLLLQYVRDKANDALLRDEAAIVIGDIYYVRGNGDVALKFYSAVPSSALRYNVAQVKIARAHLDAGQFATARDMSRSFIQKNPRNEFYFEMASILERAFKGMGDDESALKVNNEIFQQLTNTRLSFELSDELDRVANIKRSWQLIDLQAIRSEDERLRDQVRNNLQRLETLEAALVRELIRVGGDPQKQDLAVLKGRFERRYLNMIRDSVSLLGDTIADLQGRLELLAFRQKEQPNDSLVMKLTSDLDTQLNALSLRQKAYEHEIDLVITECLDQGRSDGRGTDADRQTQFVDWSFMHYVDKRDDQIASGAKAKSSGPRSAADTLENKGKEVVQLFSAIDRQKRADLLSQDRERLIEHIETLLDVFPKSDHNASLTFRLSELYYDKAADDFDVRLKRYEDRIMADPTDTASFPDYTLDKVIALYNRIVLLYPKAAAADDALFYKALALQKSGYDEEANQVLISLTEKYPESEYYVEANMKIGRYYFDHPGTADGKGYDLAEAAFRKVLYYRDHPQFVQALYHLGWCYYMKDLYEEAIAVFKYLVEEVHLDFDPGKMDENQVLNPLLREEAIDYIAISFDEEGRMEDAMNFLRLIGNADYASMVLKRVGELRVEDLDYDGAIVIYRQLLEQYPLSLAAPEASVALMKVYESMNRSELALAERERFFEHYSSRSTWQENVAQRDSAAMLRVDSMALAIGLYVGDSYFRMAEEKQGEEHYLAAAKSYQRTVRLYPDNQLAAAARWNLAVILDKKLNEKQAAYNQYLDYSRITDTAIANREQAALNAIAIAQSLLPADSAAQPGTMEMSAVKLIEAVDNYVKLYPFGKSRSKVLLAQGAVFFNRKMFGNAAEVYEKIITVDTASREHFEAAFLLGQCQFGEENWVGAATRFDYIWKRSPDVGQQEQAYKLLLQSRFLHAKSFADAGSHEKAIDAFLAIEQSYPGSEYADIVLFNAAEACEKGLNWRRAADIYQQLVRKYPLSKLAPDALFNAATGMEKANEYAKVAELYEFLVSQYPKSERAKDALFNLGFCYEKLGKLDKMAEANERYSLAYPGEKDVEVMLLRSGKFYVKAEMHEKALNVYQNYLKRFPTGPGAVEALFMTGQSFEQRKDVRNARTQYEAAENANLRLAAAGAGQNNYFAAEAAYRLSALLRDQMNEIKLTLPERILRERQKQKTDLLAEAIKGYERVVRYQSERMFEAAFLIGKLYEELVVSWIEQERPKQDPIQAAVLEKEIFTAAAALVQKTFVPYRKTIEIAAQFDSLGTDQKKWVSLARQSLSANYLRAGEYMGDAVLAMQNAPVPKAIKEKVLHLFQYQKQLLETIEPMKVQLRDYYLGAYSELAQGGLDGENAQVCLDLFSRSNFLIGNDYDQLAQAILKASGDLPSNMDPIEKEDLLFQMEDVVFELQDKALFAYEEARQRAIDNSVKGSPWYNRIMEGLARLSPETYGKSFYAVTAFESGDTWIVRSDSVASWNTTQPPSQGWTGVTDMGRSAAGFPAGYSSHVVTHSDSSLSRYYWSHVLVKGEPRDGTVYVSSTVPYRLYVNSLLTLSDTVNAAGSGGVDSAVGIVSLLKPGDNIVAVETRSTEPGANNDIAVLLTVLVDSTARYETTVKPPAVRRPLASRRQSRGAEATAQDSAGVAKKGAAEQQKAAYVQQFRNRGELLAAIEAFGAKEEQFKQEIRRERMEFQKLQLIKNALDVQINMVRKENEKLKSDLDSMGRGK